MTLDDILQSFRSKVWQNGWNDEELYNNTKAEIKSLILELVIGKDEIESYDDEPEATNVNAYRRNQLRAELRAKVESL